ncbi:hypothetical protein CDD81_7829 [Ophiocordyceps australis]|uniref:P/Homo B domain-containing protein n=1 Tax=Ophiocordyceps australis TaxID=1399860 RepID=A0A2C5YEV3_9HYPO|nr:hypothetical protein CDD81_7829 [Ophiocordyceps australis]
MDSSPPHKSLAWRDDTSSDHYVLHLHGRAQPQEVAERLGLTYERPLALDDHYLFAARQSSQDIVKRELQAHKRRKRSLGDDDALDNVLFAEKQKPRQRLHKRFIPDPPADALLPRALGNPDATALKLQSQVMDKLNIVDPIFKEQWHLYNTIQLGHDVNVTGVWLNGVTGKGTTVAIIDDGIDMHSRDLADNYFAQGSWDFNDNDKEPKPRLSDDKHGTRCAGEVAAVRNDVCGLGVAYESRVAGIRILSKPIDDASEAEAMIYKYQDNQIYSCSWGPRDDGRSMEAPGILIQRAILQAVQKGRNGLGSLYVFASGNGAASDDNCNFDGYTNSIYSITVGAVDRAGNHPYYSEKCSAQLVVTYSSGSGDSIHTTDVGTNTCATGHGGTSAAAPLAAGIFALVMQVRPDLTWRDFQYLAMDTAVPVADPNAGWQNTTIGKQFSHSFGYGKIDTFGLVESAKTWKKVKPQAWLFSPWLHVKQAIPEGKHGLLAHFEVTEDMVKEANLARLEHVTVTMNVKHTRRGDISVDLVSPNDIVSHIATARKNDAHVGGYDDWTFMSVVHWGESGIGKWTLLIRDTKENTHNGTFIDWRLKLWGEALDANKAVLLPLPNATDDADHDKTVTTGPATTSQISPLPEPPTELLPNPTDHPDRPTKPKPEVSTTLEVPTATGIAGPPSSTSSSGPLWVMGALILIIVFCCGLGTYLWIARRRRLKNTAQDDYEFELVNGEEVEGLTSGEKNGAGKNAKRTRGGELYDAFAGGSDDEEEEDEYRDRSAERLMGVGEQYVVGEESEEEGLDEKDDGPSASQ